MSLLTNWGYMLTDVDTLPNMLSLTDYNEYTANKYIADSRAALNIKAAESAIRNYCGWHVYPELDCELSTTFFDRRITKVYGGVTIQLPATLVSEVELVTIDGTEYSTFVADPDGLLRVYDVSWSGIKPYSPVVVDYKAGVPEDMAQALMELIAHRVTHALASTSGVQSESAGGVSVTYNAAWTNSARATALPDDNKEVLSPYRLRGVF